MTPSLADTDVMVLAGGKGTRIRAAIGDDLPKLLAPIDGRPYLEYLFDWLQGFGAKRVILSLGHLSDRIVRYVEDHPRAGLDVDWVVENTPLGTAGAVRFARTKIETPNALVMNGDGWIDADLNGLMAAHAKSRAPATLLCVAVEDAGRFGQIETDDRGRIMAFREKHADGGPGKISAGFYAFSDEGFDMVDAFPGPSIEYDVFARQQPGTLAAHDAGPVSFVDIGTPESLARAAHIIGRGRDDARERTT